MLLGPDGRSRCSFPPPEEGRDGAKVTLQHPRDQVWFAGDTCFGGILAAPGGLPFRCVLRSKPGRRPGTGHAGRGRPPRRPDALARDRTGRQVPPVKSQASMSR